MKAAIYARYSTDYQNETSIEAQVDECKDYASRTGMLIVKVYTDEARSGKTSNRRNGYQKLLKDAKAGLFDVILIHKYDRIARNLGEHVNLEQKLQTYNVQLIAVAQDFGSSKEGKLMRSIQWVLSEYYVDNLSEEVRKGAKVVAKKGLHNGGVAPFGYRIENQRYVINELEADYVRRFFLACLNGMSYKPILDELEERGITGHRGKTLKSSSVTEILHNEKYCGVYLYSPTEERSRALRREKPNAIRVEGAIPAIVTREEWEKVQRIMATRKNKPKTKYWCSGLVYCGNCGAKMHAQVSKKGHNVYPYYVCSKHCGQPVILVETVDNLVESYLKKLLSKKNLEEINAWMHQYIRDEKQMIADFEVTRVEKLHEKQAEIDAITANMTSGVLPQAVMQELGNKLDTLLKEKQKIIDLKPVRKNIPQLWESWLDQVVKANKPDLPRLLLDRIEIKNNSATLHSSFTELLDESGCGGAIPYLPTIIKCIVTYYQ